MDKLTIIQLVSAREAWGGIEQYAKDLAQALQERSHTVFAVTRRVDFVIKSFSEVCEVHSFPIRGSIDIESIRGIARLIREREVDIVHTHTSRDAWMALFATLVAGRGKVVTTRHGPFPAKGGVFHAWFYNRLGAIICVSEFVRQGFLSSRPRIKTSHIKLIYPGINTDKFLSAPEVDVRKPLGIDPGEFVIGCIGRISYEKGVHDVIRAASILKSRGRRCSVVVVGTLNPNTPEYMGELQRLIAAENVADVVHFYGFTSSVAGVMKNVDAVVLASTIPEASPLVLREAMLCGKPVISTDTGGQVEIVQDKYNGFLVPPDSPVNIADILEKFIVEPEFAKQIGQRGQQTAMAKFTQRQMLDEIEQCYADCLRQE